MYGIDSYEDLYGSLIEQGSQATIIEDEESAQMWFKTIEDAELTEHVDDITTEMLEMLDLTQENNVKRIITFVNGNAGSLCLSQDWSLA